MEPGSKNLGPTVTPQSTGAIDSSSLELPVTPYDLSTPLAPEGSTHAGNNLSPFRYNKRAFVVTAAALSIILLTGVVAAAFNHFSNRPSGDKGKGVASYNVGSVSLSGVKQSTFDVSEASHLNINGELKVRNTLVLSPTTVPQAPAVGQIYYDAANNAPYYFNGTSFISLAPQTTPQHVTSIGGAAGVLALGNGLQVNGSTLSISSTLLQSISNVVNAPKVTSLQGQTGDVTLTAGNGIQINGTTVTNSGVVNLTGSAGITVTNNGNGSWDVSGAGGGGGGVTSLNGLAGSLTVANASGSGSTVTIDNASTAAKGIAQFNSTNFTAVAGLVNTVQNIAATSSPTFAGLTLTTALPVTSGGTGQTSYTDGQLLIGNSATSGLTKAGLTAGAGVLITSGNGSIQISAPSSGSCSTCANTALSNLTSVAINTSLLSGTANIDLGDTANPFRDLYLGGTATNNFRFTGTATAPRVLNIPDAGGTLAVSASGNIALSAAGNITFTGQLPVANGGTNANTAAGARTNLGAAASGANTDITSLAPSATLTLGSTSQTLTLQGNSSTVWTATNGASTATVGFTAPTANIAYTFANASAGSYNICTTAGNCTGIGGGVTTPGGTTNQLAKFTGAQTLGDSNLSDDGTTVSVQGTGGLFVGTNAVAGILDLSDGSSNYTRVQAASTASNLTFTLPATAGGSGECIKSNGSGVLSFGTCLSGAGGGGGVTDVNGASGAITLAGTTSQITVTQSPAGTFTFATPQDIATSSSPAFSGLTLSSFSSAGIVHNNASGVLSTGLVALTTDTSGDYVANLGTLTGLTTSGNSGEGSTPTLSVTYGSGANTAVQGNTTLVCPSGSGNLTGGGNTITLGTGGTCSGLDTVASPSFTGNVTVQGGNITVGVAGTTAGTVTLANSSSSRIVILQGNNPTGTGNATISIPSIAGGSSDTVCLLTLANCAGAGGGVTSSGGVANQVPRYTAATTLTAGTIFDNSSVVIVGGSTTGGAALFNVGSSNQFKVDSSGNVTSGTITSGLINSQTISSSANFTGTLAVQGSNLTIGANSTQGSLLLYDGAASGKTATLKVTTGLAANTVISIPTTVGVSDTFCLLTLNNCTGTATDLQAAYNNSSSPATITTTSGTKSVIIKAGATFDQTALFQVQSAASAAVLTVDTANLQVVASNATIAAGGSLSITGGVTGTRPALPTEGMLYYDTTTKSLLVYANGKWQADRTTTTKAVGMGTAAGCTGSSPVSSSNADASDFVVTSCTSAQTTIQSAISALPAGGGTVYLMEGTYIIDGAIVLPSNVTLAGSGVTTILKLKDGINAGVTAIDFSNNAVRATVKEIKLDGNKTNNTSGTQRGIDFSATGTTVPGVTISRVTVENFRSEGFYASTGSYASVLDSVAISNGAEGFNITGVDNSVIQGNISLSNTGTGISILAGNGSTISNNIAKSNSGDGFGTQNCDHCSFTGNSSNSNTGDGIVVYGDGMNVMGNVSSTNTGDGIVIHSNGSEVVGNTIYNNSGAGINLLISASDNIVSDNRIENNGSTGSSNGINFNIGASNNIFTGNRITDTAGTGCAISGSSTSTTGNYFSNNTYSGTGAASICSFGSNPIIANQLDANNNLIMRATAGVGVNTSTITASMSLQGGLNITQLPAPAAPTVAKVGTAGSTTWAYTVTALDGLGETVASTATQIANGNATLNGTNYNTISWTAIPGAIQYKVYRTTAGGTPSTTGLIATLGANVVTYNDQGVAGSGASPAANTTGGATVAGNLTVSGTGLFKNTANGTTAFQIQNVAGNTLFNVDTQNAGVSVGNAGLAGTIQIGNTTGAVAQTINIGNNATASSISTVVIGSAIGTSPVTIQSGTSGVLVKGANTTTAFQIQNAAGTSTLLVADTSNLTVTVSGQTTTAIFAAKIDSTAGTSPWGAATGDFNGDGKTDAIISNNGAATASVYINSGSALPTTATSTLTTGTGPRGISTGDFNGDGKTDAIIVNFTSATASVYINSGSALPTTATYNLTTGTDPWDVAVGDFNNDGKTDAIVTNFTSNTASVYINSGSALPTTATSTLSTGASSAPREVATGDFNGDGKLDVIIATPGTSTASVYINSGAALPTTATSTLTASNAPWGIATGDFNGDGKTDALVTNIVANTVSVYINSGAALPTTANYTLTSGNLEIAAGDFNGDGKTDAVSSSSLSVYINSGAALPTTATSTLTAGTGPRSIATGDFNGDGKLDLIVANSTSNTASVLINNTPNALTVNGQYTQNGNLAVSGQGLFRNTADTVNAFQIQNANGASLFSVDTLGSNISLGSAGLAGTVQIGNTNGAFAQTINIGNNTTASSLTNVTAGSTVGASALTLQSGTSGIAATSTATTGNALALAANSLTTGNGLQVTSTSSALTSGSLLSISSTATYTSAATVSGNISKASRSLTANIPAVTYDAGSATTTTISSTWSSINSYTVTANHTLVVLVSSNAGTKPTGVSFNSIPLTKYGEVSSAVNILGVTSQIWILPSTNVPSNTTANITFTSSATNHFVTAATFSNVDSVNPAGTVVTAGGTSATASVSGASTNASDMLVSLVSDTTNCFSSGGDGPTAAPTPSGGETSIGSAFFSDTFVPNWCTSGGGVATGVGYKAAATSSSWATNTGSTLRDWALAAVPLKAQGINITGGVANFSSNCALTSGNCTDSSSILTLNQQYASATGAVLTLQNAGSGAAIALTQTGSSTIDIQLAQGNVQTAGGTTSTAINLQSGNASAGASGAATLQSGTGTTGTGTVTIKSGNASAGASGNITVDTGTFTSGTPTISIGTANASAVSIGRSGQATTINGTLTVTQAVTFSSTLSVKNVTIAGHIITGNTTGSTAAAAGANAGSTGTCVLNPASFAVGNDTSGTIVLTPSGTGIAAGTQCTVTASAAFGSFPHVVVSPADSASAALSPYAAATANNTWNLGFVNAGTTGTAYTFNYFVTQ